jgi:integral membrane sensor domain MASE1
VVGIVPEGEGVGEIAQGFRRRKWVGAFGVIGEKLEKLLEAQRGTTVLWAPVALTFGIWFYFSLPQEPAIALAGTMACLAIIVFWRAKGRMAMVLIAILLSGFVLAKFQ